MLARWLLGAGTLLGCEAVEPGVMGPEPGSEDLRAWLLAVEPASGPASAGVGSLATVPALAAVAPALAAVALRFDVEPRVLWRFRSASPVSGSPAVSATGQTYVASVEGVVHALGADGAFRWSYGLMGMPVGAPAIDRGGQV